MPPNIFVIQPDQHRGTIMGCAGDPQAITPNLDRLAEGGIHFTRAVSSSPVCSPFRATLQTGLYQHTHGMDRNNILLDPDLTCFAECFASAGYATGYIGKWHLDGGIPEGGAGGFVEPGPRRRGWQEWHGYEKGHEYFDVFTYDHNRQKVRLTDYDWEPIWHTDMALNFATRHSNEGRPWIYYLGYGPPHKPEQCPDRFLDMYDPNAFQLPPDLDPLLPDREADLRKIYQIYYGQVTAVDHEIGRLMAGLKDLGLDRDTLIFYVSDHGDKLGSHCPPDMENLRGKSSPHATSFCVPLILHWPERIPSGQVCDTLVNSVDLTPTLLDLAGLDIPSAMQGDSMAEWCLGNRGPENGGVYLGLGGITRKPGWRAVWDGRYIYAPLGYNHLYDHQTDPYEMHNRIDDPEYAAVKKRMAGLLVDLAQKTDDPMLPQVKAACSA